MAKKEIKKVTISTYKCDNLYFSVGVSQKTKKIVRIGLPRSLKEEALKEISDYHPQFEVSNKHQKIARKISEAYNGKVVDINLDQLEISQFKTSFERKVLLEVKKIPHGEFRTYKDIAEKIQTHGYRAVGSAIGKNPFPLIIPCHRVIRSDLNLGGYRGEMEMKRSILENEGIKVSGNKVIKPNSI
jgi:methylated-DNA-[protein]-cysteine S-methyltransferase